MSTLQDIARKYAVRDLDTVRLAMSMTPGRSCVVQAGGCLGVFPKFLAREFERVYTFEPDAASFAEMCRWLDSHLNVYKFQAALGAHHEMVDTVQRRRTKTDRPAHPGISWVQLSSGLGSPTMLIDDLALPFCDLLILDLEGYELRALAGARDTIRRCRPTIMVEINENCRHYDMVEDDVRTHLRMSNYQFQVRKHSDEVWTPC